MLRVTLDINGDPIDTIEVVNCGPTALANTQDGPSDERWYSVRVCDGKHRPNWMITHRRSDGARVLAHLALAEVLRPAGEFHG